MEFIDKHGVFMLQATMEQAQLSFNTDETDISDSLCGLFATCAIRQDLI